MAETTEATVYAWDTEDQYAVVYGTHDAEAARAAYLEYLKGCGFVPGDDEYSPLAESRHFYADMAKWWTDPKDDEEPFDRHAEPGEGRVPWMAGVLA